LHQLNLYLLLLEHPIAGWLGLYYYKLRLFYAFKLLLYSSFCTFYELNGLFLRLVYLLSIWVFLSRISLLFSLFKLLFLCYVCSPLFWYLPHLGEGILNSFWVRLLFRFMLDLLLWNCWLPAPILELVLYVDLES
jgi:hypothetical protein